MYTTFKMACCSGVKVKGLEVILNSEADMTLSRSPLDA